MAQYRYATKTIEQDSAKAVARDVSISTKTSVEIANRIRGKHTARAKKILEDAISLTTAIPYKRFTNGPGHKKGPMASGRYSVKACQIFLDLIKSAESNAQDKGLSAKDLLISRLVVQRASQPWHYGRQSRIKMKRSHVEIVVQENEPEKKQDKKPEKAAAEKEVSQKTKIKEEKNVKQEPQKEKQEKQLESHKPGAAEKIKDVQIKKTEKKAPEVKPEKQAEKKLMG